MAYNKELKKEVNLLDIEKVALLIDMHKRDGRPRQRFCVVVEFEHHGEYVNQGGNVQSKYVCSSAI